MELRHIRSSRKLDPDNWGWCGLSVILRQPLANLCRSHSDDGIVRGIIVDRPSEHFYADHALTQGVQVTRQSVFDDQSEKVLTAYAWSKCIARDHRLERAPNQVSLFGVELMARYGLLSRCHRSYSSA